MRLGAASAGLVVGALGLTSAALAADLVSIAPMFGLDVADPEVALRLTRMVAGGLGVVGLVSGGIAFVAAMRDPRERWAPWVRAMSPLAGEHGREVEVDPRDGIGFLSFTEGVRLEVLVLPREDGFVNVWMEAPGRQRLLFAPLDLDEEGDDAEWRLTGQRNGWVLRSDLPSVARPLLRDGGLVEVVTELMAFPSVRAVRHDGSGIEILSDLVPPESLGPMLRTSLRVCRRLRRLNA